MAWTDDLILWYEKEKRDLPWRTDVTAYRVWVSEIMLQQTRVAEVIGYFTRFIDTFPETRALRAADDETLMRVWQGLGYYSRARNMRAAAAMIEDKYSGIFPDEYETLLTLPGVGEYTAGAVASIAFGRRVPCVDGNVLRVMSRFWADDGDIRLPETRKRFRTELEKILPPNAPGTFNQALMELGALVCVPNGAPKCAQCPLRGNCEAEREDLTDALPVRSLKPPRRIERRKVYLIFRDDRLLLHRRPDKGLLAGMWELPSAPAENAVPPVAFLRESPGPRFRHVFTHLEWVMEGVILEAAGSELPDNCVWALPEEAGTRYPVPGAFRGFLKQARIRPPK